MSLSLDSAYTSGTDTSRTIEPDASSRNDQRLWWILAGVALVATVVVRIIVALSASAPRAPWDEIGILQMARIIAGDDDITKMSGAGYFPGMSFLLAPIWLFTSDAETVYVASVVVGNILGLAAIWPMTSIARRLGLSIAPAVLAAALVMLLPARTALADYVLAEQLLGTMVVWSVAAGFWVWNKPTALRMLGFAAVAAGAYLSHTRALSLLLAAGIWALLFFRRRISTAIIGVISIVVGYFVVQWISSWTTDAVLLGDFGQGDLFADNLRSTWASLFMRVMTAHSWAQLVGSYGLVMIGAVILIVWTWRELRSRAAIGPIGYMFGVALSGALVGFIAWSGPETMLAVENPRFDTWVYTRYIDPYAMLVVLIALVLLFRTSNRLILILSTVFAGIISVAMIYGSAPIIPTFGTRLGPGNAAGVLPWAGLWNDIDEYYDRPQIPTFTNDGRFFVWASLAVIATLLVLLIVRRFPKVIALVVLVVLTTASIIGNPEQLRDYPRFFVSALDRIEQVGEPNQAVDFDLQCGNDDVTRAQALNWSGYWLSPRDVDTVEPGEPFSTDVVIACDNWDRAAAEGALLVPDSSQYTYSVWVRPGELQDELVREGVLR